MLLIYYTIRALAREWGRQDSSDGLVGKTIVDAFSAARDELTLRLAGSDGSADTLRISVRPGMAYVFRQPEGSKPRKNTTPLLRPIHGHEITGVEVVEGDRMLDLLLRGGIRVRAILFGSAANVFAADAGGRVLESFRDKAARDTLPEGRPGAMPATPAALGVKWPQGAYPLEKAVSRGLPLFDRWLAQETVDRAGLDIADACLAETQHLEALLEAASAILKDLERPSPRLYREGRNPVALSLIPLHSPPGEESVYASADEAVRVFVRATLAERGFTQAYQPLVMLVEQAAGKSAEGLRAMREQLAKPTRADTFETWGHLLMATLARQPAGMEEAQVPNLFGAGETLSIPLDPALSAAENANRYYDKARRSRRAREEAERRVHEAVTRSEEDQAMLEALAEVQDTKGLRAFQQAFEGPLGRLRGAGGASAPGVPFREYKLAGGYVVWVGRNAKQNDQLTFRHARKQDLWLHARGVAGSHTILRVQGRAVRPPPAILEAAASIAAFHSKARGSGLVPVIVTERKYVRKPRKAPPGAVLVDREEVLIVPPAEPS